MLSVGEPDGAGLFGVLDETEDGLLCHECGLRFVHLGLHAWRRHGISADDYRETHGLARTRGLVTTATRKVIADNARERIDAKSNLLAARSPRAAAKAPRTVSPQGRERIRATNRASRGRRRLGTVIVCEWCTATFCPLTAARKRRLLALLRLSVQSTHAVPVILSHARRQLRCNADGGTHQTASADDPAPFRWTILYGDGATTRPASSSGMNP